MGRLFNALIRVGELAGAAAIAIIAAIVVFDVIARALGFPTLWALEVSAYLMVAAAVMAAAAVEVQGEHFEVRLFLDWLPARAVRVIDTAVAILTTAFVLAVTWGAFAFVQQSIGFGFRSPTLLRVPLSIPQSVLLAGLFLLSLASAARLFRRLSGSSQTST
jgi:TRAP-type C4-dicarboxylate transport system permease small subunit